MTEEQYKALCEACDRLLLAEDSTLERVAIPWLHVIREHPVILHQYNMLFEERSLLKQIASMLKRSLYGWLVFLNQALRSLRSGGAYWFGPAELPKSTDILFVSHLLNPGQAGLAVDFYFGSVPDELGMKGYTSLIALINHSGQSGSLLASRWKQASVQRIVLSNTLKLKEEVALRLRARKQSRYLNELSRKEKFNLYQAILRMASKEAVASATLSNLRMAEQIRSLVISLKPKALVVTHEGHGWERAAFSAARSAHPTIRCIGYQHAAIFRKQHALMRNLTSQYNPDCILSAGGTGKRQLENAPKLKGISIGILGSNRGSNAKTTIEGDVLENQPEKLTKKKTCLVLPEGFISECQILFEFSIRCAVLCPEIEFIWRLHPIISQKELRAKIKVLRKLPANISFSSASMAEDLDRCHWALYRGTTAIAQAVGEGLKPIYLSVPGEMTINPLYEVEAHIDKVETENDFKQLIESDNNENRNAFASNITVVQKYCENYYSPFHYQQLANCLKK